jgi:glyoxylase-like metal-dependent hydrolase (beta-lactamase superfamily II)
VQIFSLEGNTQRLDGGAMFGNCNPRDACGPAGPRPTTHNRIRLACRSMLVREDSGAHVLLETGIGAFFEPKMRERFGVQEPEHVLLRSLAELGVAPEDIDVVVLSHLHFDHAGGLLSAWSPGAPRAGVPEGPLRRQRRRVAARPPPAPARPRLLHPWPSGHVAGDRPPRAGRGGAPATTLGDGLPLHVSDGHTPGLMLTRVEGRGGAITFLGDLVPGVPWVHLPITMGYDRYPELLIDEKEALLANIVAEHGWAFYTHDPAAAESPRGVRGCVRGARWCATRGRRTMGLDRHVRKDMHFQAGEN